MFNNVVVSIITCTSKNSVIGIDGKLPWYYPKDLIFFKNVTSGYHYPTICAESEEVLDAIQEELKQKGFLAKLQDYEPVDFWGDNEDEAKV